MTNGEAPQIDPLPSLSPETKALREEMDAAAKELNQKLLLSAAIPGFPSSEPLPPPPEMRILMTESVDSPADELTITVTPAEKAAPKPVPITPVSGWMVIKERTEEELKSDGGIILVSEQARHANKLGSHWRLGRIVRTSSPKLQPDGNVDRFDAERHSAMPEGALIFFDYRACGQILYRGAEWTLCPRDRAYAVLTEEEPPGVAPAV